MLYIRVDKRGWDFIYNANYLLPSLCVWFGFVMDDFYGDYCIFYL